MLGSLFDALTGKGGADTPKVSATNIYELPDGTDVDGNPFEYTSLKGKVVLITMWRRGEARRAATMRDLL